ncbi:MAG: hypothetical protein ISS73_11915 [Pirellulales bacterium]|nr:hypothetical protein [Pirellulales bacterium]
MPTSVARLKTATTEIGPEADSTAGLEEVTQLASWHLTPQGPNVRISGDGRKTCKHTKTPATRPPLHAMVIRRHVFVDAHTSCTISFAVTATYQQTRHLVPWRRVSEDKVLEDDQFDGVVDWK